MKQVIKWERWKDYDEGITNEESNQKRWQGQWRGNIITIKNEKKGLREDVFNIKELILNVYVLGGIC